MPFLPSAYAVGFVPVVNAFGCSVIALGSLLVPLWVLLGALCLVAFGCYMGATGRSSVLFWPSADVFSSSSGGSWVFLNALLPPVSVCVCALSALTVSGFGCPLNATGRSLLGVPSVNALVCSAMAP